MTTIYREKESAMAIKSTLGAPNMFQLEAELKRVRIRRRLRGIIYSTVYGLVVVEAVAVLVVTQWMPVLEIYGASMTPTLDEGEMVVSTKGSSFKRGDVVAFYCGNKLLVKCYIASPSEWVSTDLDGTVYVDGEMPIRYFEAADKAARDYLYNI